MAQRMNERFTEGDAVEIYFPQIDRWLAGVVNRFESPGAWVHTLDGRPWFVTNGRRIRPFNVETETEEDEDES